jgi:hypothetical protein
VEAGDRRRRGLLVLAAGTALAAGVLAWPWLRTALVEPLALVAWLLLRVFVLSVHHAAWWVALLLAGTAVLVGFALRRAAAAGPGRPLVTLPPVRPGDSWRWLIQQTVAGQQPAPAIGWNGFVRLAVSLAALERRAAPDYRVLEELRDGQAPLPAEVHAFLFPPPAPPARWAVRQARRLAGAPRRALRRLSGRDRAERVAAIERLLSFLESSLEVPPHEHAPDRPVP